MSAFTGSANPTPPRETAHACIADADVERCCDELVDLASAVRLRLVTELRAALDEVTTAALTSGMVAAKQQG